MSANRGGRPDGRRKQFKRVPVGVSVPTVVAEEFKRNLARRGFTERGDLSRQVNRALNLYLERIGAFELVAEEDARRFEERWREWEAGPPVLDIFDLEDGAD